MAGLRSTKRHRAPSAAAPFFWTLGLKRCSSPRMGRSTMSNLANSHSPFRLRIASLLAGIFALAGMAQADGQPVCRPALAFKDVQFSPMQPPTLERRWTATVAVDASRCAIDSGGVLRNWLLAAQGNRRRDRFPRAVHLAGARSESVGRFLGRRSRGGLLVQ